MSRLALQLVTGGGRDGRLQAILPVVAVAVATALLLLTIGAWQGITERNVRSAWLEMAPSDAAPTALSLPEASTFEGDPIDVLHLAALGPDASPPPGMAAFPQPGEVWVSPALGELIAAEDDARLGDRFDGPPTGTLGRDAVTHPDHLVAVLGHGPDDSLFAVDRETTSVGPVSITDWNEETTQVGETYQALGGIGVAFMVVPLLALGGSAARLVAARRNARLSLLRLIGGSVRQVVGLTAVESGLLAVAGAITGAGLYGLLLPAATRVELAGGGWFPIDIWVGVPVLLLAVAGVVAVVMASAVIGLVPVVRDPFGTARAQHPGRARIWRLGLLIVGVAGFLVFGAGSWRLVALPVALVLMGIGVAGPLGVKVVGLVMARTARSPARLLAGRRLAEDPRSGWRAVAGVVLGGFIAGFAAIAAPTVHAVAMGDARTLEVAVLVEDANAVEDLARTRLEQAGIAAAAGEQLDAVGPSDGEGDVTLRLPIAEDADLERARTALTGVVPGSTFQTASEQFARDVGLLDDIGVGATVVLISAFLVAAVSAGVGGITRVLDQRGPLTLLRLAGAPLSVLAKARRTEVTAPLLLFGGGATALGMLLGAFITRQFRLPDGRGVLLFVGLLAVGLGAVLAADLISRPILRTATAALADRQ